MGKVSNVCVFFASRADTIHDLKAAQIFGHSYNNNNNIYGESERMWPIKQPKPA